MSTENKKIINNNNNNNKLLEKYDRISNKVSNIIKEELDCKPSTRKNFLKPNKVLR